MVKNSSKNLHHPLFIDGEVPFKQKVNFDLFDVVSSAEDGSSIKKVIDCRDRLNSLKNEHYSLKNQLKAGVSLDFVHNPVDPIDAESVVSQAISEFENNVENFEK